MILSVRAQSERFNEWQLQLDEQTSEFFAKHPRRGQELGGLLVKLQLPFVEPVALGGNEPNHSLIAGLTKTQGMCQALLQTARRFAG